MAMDAMENIVETTTTTAGHMVPAIIGAETAENYRMVTSVMQLLKIRYFTGEKV